MTTTPQTNTTLEAVARELYDRDNFVLCGHVSPDGDCLGSQLALMHTLKALGKSVACVLVKDEPIDDNLAFMPGSDSFIFSGAYDGACDVFIALDVPNRDRIGKDASGLLDRAAFSITIDHHAYEERMSSLAYVDPDAASTTMLIWQLCKLLMEQPPIESAICAYTGLVTDTGCFKFQNTDAWALEAGSEMVAAGVKPSEITRNVMQNRSLASLKLEAMTIDRMVFSKNGCGVVSWVSEDDFKATGAKKDDADPLVDTLRMVRGISVAVMLREQDGLVRCNLRAKDDSDVSAIARSFGGGGHVAAAGCKLHMGIDEAVETMLNAIDEQIGCE